MQNLLFSAPRPLSDHPSAAPSQSARAEQKAEEKEAARRGGKDGSVF